MMNQAQVETNGAVLINRWNELTDQIMATMNRTEVLQALVPNENRNELCMESLAVELARDWMFKPTVVEREWHRASDDRAQGIDYWCFFCLHGAAAQCSRDHEQNFPKCQNGVR
jgi:hypothetical protein